MVQFCLQFICNSRLFKPTCWPTAVTCSVGSAIISYRVITFLYNIHLVYSKSGAKVDQLLGEAQCRKKRVEAISPCIMAHILHLLAKSFLIQLFSKYVTTVHCLVQQKHKLLFYSRPMLHCGYQSGRNWSVWDDLYTWQTTRQLSKFAVRNF